jgi:ribosomal peptide maturation radical SAM protein 1
MFDCRDLTGDGEVLLVIPPFAGLDRPSLAAHLLQACAARRGHEVRVLYLNMALAAEIGEVTYQAIAYAPTSALLGERFFARAAYGVPTMGRDEVVIEGLLEGCEGHTDFSPAAVADLEQRIYDWTGKAAASIARGAYRVAGFSTTFEQTAAATALLNRVKQLAPETVCIVGGANCEGEMAEGIASLPLAADYIFRGESERSFPEFLDQLAAGAPPASRIVDGELCRDMGQLPTPDFTEYFAQRDLLLPESFYASHEQAWLPYESSRGCWWGEKHHCTFCGVNGAGMSFRQKPAGRVLAELHAITTRHGLKRVCMVDNIMPHNYFQTLLPHLADAVPDLYLFYEQKANLKLHQVAALKQAGVGLMQPGIEALSTPLLRRMDKGVTGHKNVALLRYARSNDLEMNWNLLYGFPGDGEQEYRETLVLMRLIHHLQPPTDLCRLSVDRFSPYHSRFGDYGIRSIRPMDSYNAVLPDGADVDKVAYHFLGDYDSAILANAELLAELEQELSRWKALWNEREAPPALAVMPAGEDEYLLYDSRGLEGAPAFTALSEQEAMAVLVTKPMRHCGETEAWARRRRYATEMDGFHVALATTTTDLLARFESEASAEAGTAFAILGQA